MLDAAKHTILFATAGFLVACQPPQTSDQTVGPRASSSAPEVPKTPGREHANRGTSNSQNATGCPTGQHNNGNGTCAPKFACADGFKVLDNGRCGQFFKASPPVFPWSHQTLKLRDGRVFVFGWQYRQRSSAGLRTGFGPRIALTYDPDRHAWTRIEPPRAPRTRPGLASMTDGRVMVAGGVAWKKDAPEPSSRVDVYDPKSNSWGEAASLPTPRVNPVMVGRADGSVVVAGGRGADESEALPVLLYNPDNDTWSEKATSSVELRGHAVQTFELTDGDILLVPGCSASADATDPCPLKRLEVDAGKWMDVGDDSWRDVIATRLPDDKVFLFDGRRDAAVYDPEAAPDDALVHFEQAGRLSLEQAEHAFAIDEKTVALVDLPQRVWVISLDASDKEFEVVEDHRQYALDRPTGRSSLVPLGPGEAFALLGAEHGDPAFLAPRPTGMRIALDTDGVEGFEHLRPWWQSPAAYMALPMSAPVIVDDVEGGPPDVTSRIGEAVLDWMAAAWAAEKEPRWIADALALDIQGTQLRSSVDEDGILDASTRVADFDDDGDDDLLVSFAAQCGSDNDRMVPGCDWLTALVPGSGGWALIGTAREMTGAREQPLELGPAIDFTGDGVPELVLEQVVRANHADRMKMMLFSSDSSPSLRPILFESEYLTTLESQHGINKLRIGILTPDDRNAYLEVTFGVAASAAASTFQRATLQRWEWNPDTRRIGPVPARQGGTRGYRWEQTPEKNRMRLHRFGDALYALEAHDYREAERIFEQIVSGDDIADTFGGSKNANPERRTRGRAQFRQYALFMMGRIALERGDSERAARLKRRLETDFPGGPMPAALEKLEKEFRSTGDMATACEQSAPHGREAFGEEWVFGKSVADYKPVEFGGEFGDRGLCAGLNALPEDDHRTRTDMLEPGYLRVQYFLRNTAKSHVELLARHCPNRRDDCNESCKLADLPGHQQGIVRARVDATAPPNELIWKVDCEKISPRKGAKLCLMSKRGGEPVLEIQPRRGDLCGRK